MSKEEKTPDDFGGARDFGPEIPVRALKFRNGLSVDLPGKPTASGVASSDPKPQAYYTIVYLPKLRMHRVEYMPPGPAKVKRKSEIVYVPDSWATWSPL